MLEGANVFPVASGALFAHELLVVVVVVLALLPPVGEGAIESEEQPSW